jgi:hypothetical protein
MTDFYRCNKCGVIVRDLMTMQHSLDHEDDYYTMVAKDVAEDEGYE